MKSDTGLGESPMTRVLPLFEIHTEIVQRCFSVHPHTTVLYKMSTEPYQNGDAPHRQIDDESDVEEEAMIEDYRQQVDYEDGMNADLDDGAYGGVQQDIQAQLQAAVTPLEYGASLDAKFASYDNYVSLFHYILNSDGPVELELPSVCQDVLVIPVALLTV